MVASSSTGWVWRSRVEEDAPEEALLVPEVVVDDGVGDPGFDGDGADGRPLEAPGGEQRLGGLQDAGSGIIGLVNGLRGRHNMLLPGLIRGRSALNKRMAVAPGLYN